MITFSFVWALALIQRTHIMHEERDILSGYLLV